MYVQRIEKKGHWLGHNICLANGMLVDLYAEAWNMLCTARFDFFYFYHQLARLVEQIWTKRVTSLCQPTPTQRFPTWLSGKEFICWCRRCRRHRFNPCVGKDALEKGLAIRSSILPSKSHGPRTWWATVHGVTKSQAWVSLPSHPNHEHMSTNKLLLFEVEKKNRKKEGKVAIIASRLTCFEAIKIKVFWEWEKSMATVVTAWAPKRRNIFAWKHEQCGSSLGGSVVKNPPTNAGDMGLITDLGRSRLPGSN